MRCGPNLRHRAGWIKTLDKYFVDQTNKILTNVVAALTQVSGGVHAFVCGSRHGAADPEIQDASKTFIWAEISYLSMWWDIQAPSAREQLRALVATGQLEIGPGGWVMPDEATTHYFALLDQLIEGHQVR